LTEPTGQTIHRSDSGSAGQADLRGWRWNGADAPGALLERAAKLAERHTISVYDASYAAAADEAGNRLVSCDERDLISKGLAALPGDDSGSPHDRASDKA
jgi:hypothetical protein